MRTKIVYVLVSSEHDIYLEQAYVSMSSVRYYMPDAYIVLVTDVATAETFEGTRESKVSIANEIIKVDLDAKKYNAQKRSRLLKTSVRNYVQGDYIFIDTDTIIVKPLDDIDNISTDIAACWDTHSLAKSSPFYYMTLRDGRKLNWDIEHEEEYFNSGVIYVKDSETSRKFYELWHKNLQEGYKYGVTMDQPSFAKTNSEMGHIIRRLPDVWNCQLKYGIKYLKDAKIVHYLTTNRSHNKSKQLFVLNDADVFDRQRKNAELDETILKTIKDPFYGLADVTHCFAGDDVLYFSTILYDFTRSLYKTRSAKVLEFLIRVYCKIKRIFCR